MVEISLTEKEKQTIRNDFANGLSITKIRKAHPEFEQLSGKFLIEVLGFTNFQDYLKELRINRSKLRYKDTNGELWRLNREEVLKAFKNKCALCDNSAKEVHHLLGVDQGHDKDFLIPLCSSHHSFFYGRY